MGLAGNIEADIVLNASADKFYKVFSSQVHHVPNASEKIHAVEVHEGDWETAGSIKVWKYTMDGKTEEFKEKVDFDDEKRSITFEAVEGHILERYKKYKATFQVSENDEGRGIVKMTLEYEKFNEEDDPPHKFLNLVADVVRDVDAHIVNI